MNCSCKSLVVKALILVEMCCLIWVLIFLVRKVRGWFQSWGRGWMGVDPLSAIFPRFFKVVSNMSL